MNRLAIEKPSGRLAIEPPSRGIPPLPGHAHSGGTLPRRGEALRILVLEDDLLLASRLAGDIRRGGDRVIGPFSSVGAALRMDDSADAAILDIEAGQELSFALADRFRERQRPFLFHSGLPASMLPFRLKEASLHRKPCATADLLADLRGQTRPSAPQPGPCELIPQMRLLARQLVHDRAAADRLVEAVLVAAIRESGDCQEQGLADSLLARLEYEFCRNGRGNMI